MRVGLCNMPYLFLLFHAAHLFLSGHLLCVQTVTVLHTQAHIAMPLPGIGYGMVPSPWSANRPSLHLPPQQTATFSYCGASAHDRDHGCSQSVLY